MLPAQDAKPTPPAPAEPIVVPSTDSPLPPVAEKPMKPIGPEGLAALREAIRSGEYPSDDAVRAGIERLLKFGAAPNFRF